jgi:hypothetical protein
LYFGQTEASVCSHADRFPLLQIDGKPWEVTDAGGQTVEQKYAILFAIA